MGVGLVVRAAVVVSLGAFTALAAASCVATYSDCDYVVRRCRTVCDYWCDYWGCYPRCWDQCWYDCYYYASPPPPPPPPQSPPPDGSAPPATSTGTAGLGVLCSPCSSNDDCQSGSLCIEPGGEAGAQAPFCARSCQASADCPGGFSCTELGTSRQCLPVADGCH